METPIHTAILYFWQAFLCDTATILGDKLQGSFRLSRCWLESSTPAQSIRNRHMHPKHELKSCSMDSAVSWRPIFRRPRDCALRNAGVLCGSYPELPVLGYCINAMSREAHTSKRQYTFHVNKGLAVYPLQSWSPVSWCFHRVPFSLGAPLGLWWVTQKDT